MHQSEDCFSQRTSDRRRLQPRSVSLVSHSSLALLLLLLLGPHSRANAQQYAPQPNRRAASVQWNNTWYIQGGFYSSFLSSFTALDLSTNWTTASPPWKALPDGTAASHFALVATKDGRIWSVGGGSKQALFSVFDLSTNGPWQSLPMGVAAYSRGLEGHAAIVVPNDDKIYIVGGFSNTTNAAAGSPQTFNANLITAFQTTEPSGFVQPGPTQAQIGTTSWNDMGWAWLSKKQAALFFGGTRALPGSASTPLGALQQFVPWKNEWTAVTTTGTPSARLDHCMAANGDGSKVVVFGGNDGTNYLSDIHILDTETNTWSQGPSAAQPRTRMVCTIHNNQLIAWGGSYGNKAPETIVNGTPIIFNLNTNSWVTSFTASAINTEPGSDHDVNKDLPKPPSYNPGGESKVPLGAIIGGAAGGVLLLALLAFLFYRRSRRRASDDQNKTSNKKQKNKEYSDDHTDSEAVMSTNSFYDGELGVNPLGATTAPIASSHRPPNQHSYQYYYTPPEYDSFTPESEPPPRPPPAPPLDNGSVGSGTQRPYTPPVSDQSAYEHYYNAAGIATAAAAASSFHPRSGLDGSNLMHLYEPSDNTASTATTPLTKLSTVTSASAGTGAASIPSASPTSSFGTPRSTQPLLEATSPRINRATRPAVSSPQTGLDRMLMAHTSQETDGSGATFFQPGSGVGGGRVYTAGAGAGAGATQVDDTYRPQSMVSNSSTNTSRTGSAPQYVPPGPSRHSQWFGSPQDYDGGRTPTVYSSRASRGSEPSPTTTASVVLGGPGSQQSKVWGNHHQHHQNHYQSHVEGSQQGRGDGGTGLRGGTVAPRSLRFKNPQEGVSEESATEYVPPPPVRPRNWG